MISLQTKINSVERALVASREEVKRRQHAYDLALCLDDMGIDPNHKARIACLRLRDKAIVQTLKLERELRTLLQQDARSRAHRKAV